MLYQGAVLPRAVFRRQQGHHGTELRREADESYNFISPKLPIDQGHEFVVLDATSNATFAFVRSMATMQEGWIKLAHLVLTMVLLCLSPVYVQ